MTNLKRVPSRAGKAIYGPVHSRRIGVDIGINLLTQTGKTCNFDCIYCQYGRTNNLIKDYSGISNWISVNEVLKSLDRKLNSFSKSNYHLDAVTFSGYGEPTLHPHFDILVKEAKKIKDKYYPEARFTLITNSTNLYDEKIFKSVFVFDQVLAKLDTAIKETFYEINRPKDRDLDLDKIIDTLRILSNKIKKLIIQTLIFEVTNKNLRTNSTYEEFLALSEAICKIKPKEVQIYTLVRKAALNSIKPASIEKLNQLKNMINNKCGEIVKASVY